MAETTIEAPQTDGAVVKSQEDTREPERYVSPRVDIYETQEGLMLLADLPGVSKDALDIEVKDDILTVAARPAHNRFGTSTYREFELAPYFRQFQLSDKVNANAISAELKGGVLTLKLPKAEEAKPKRIEVQVA